MAQLSLSELTRIGAEISALLDFNYTEYIKPENNEWLKFCIDRAIEGRYSDEFFWSDILTFNEVGEFDAIVLQTMLGNDWRLKVTKRVAGLIIPKLDWSRFKDKMNEKAQRLAQMQSLIPRDDICDILNLGDTTAYTSYDGLPVFANNHPKGNTTYSNLTSLDLNAANLATAINQMALIPSDDGPSYPLGIRPTHIFVPPQLQWRAWELINSTKTNIPNQFNDNPFFQRLAVVPTEKLTNPFHWFLVAIPEEVDIKPFIYVHNKDFEPMELIFEKDKYPGYLAWEGEGYAKTYNTHPYLIQKNAGTA